MSLEKRTRYDESNRLALLAIHGLLGVVVGVLLLAYGPPDPWIEMVGEGKGGLLAAPALLGGFLLLGGLFVFNRNMFLEATGMTLILAWDFTMVLIIQKFGLNPYAVAVYAGLAALMLVHVITLIRYVLAKERV